MAHVIAICKSKTKGTIKHVNTDGLFQVNFGLIDDAHADYDSHRQVSMLAIESINKLKVRGLPVGPGDFAENITTKGIEIHKLPVGTDLLVGDSVVLTITQIGKECHAGCAIFKQVGKCIMPREGVFARVVRGGLVKAGDLIRLSSRR
jgi:MOSC domain-containing protein YiiM